ncbi:MAG: T9SS type A sorting domain-containing protein [Bacteroidetes bacterium]|nr:T9SS type A sorting domain-containing protein [Bacteroidota bacterium]
MKKKFLLFSFLLAVFWSSAQMVKPFIVNSTGGSGNIAGNVYDWSFAEMTIISTMGSSNLIVTSGIMQPIDPNVGTEELPVAKGTINVFPNPVSDILNLETNFNDPGKLSYQLVDMTGKQIRSKSLELGTGSNTNQVSLDGFSAGEYLLLVLFQADHPGEKASQSFKIQKVR